MKHYKRKFSEIPTAELVYRFYPTSMRLEEIVTGLITLAVHIKKCEVITRPAWIRNLVVEVQPTMACAAHCAAHPLFPAVEDFRTPTLTTLPQADTVAHPGEQVVHAKTGAVDVATSLVYAFFCPSAGPSGGC